MIPTQGRRVIAGILAIICAFFLFQSDHLVFAQDNKLVIAGDEEKEGSYLVEITEEAFKRVGYVSEFRFVPWVRALKNSIEGEYDVLLAAYYTEERAEKLTYSDPIGVAETMLLKLKERHITYNRVEDLKPYRIGHILGSKVSGEFDEAERTYLTIEYVSDAEQNIRKLLLGRIDLVVEKKQRIAHLLDTVLKKDKHKVAFIYPPLKINHFHNCVSKIRPRHRQIVDDFNRGLKMIREDGTEEKILKMHGLAAPD